MANDQSAEGESLSAKDDELHINKNMQFKSLDFS